MLTKKPKPNQMKNYNPDNIRVGIRFSDNDFLNTVRNFLILLAANYEGKSSELTKAKVVEMFNFCAPAVYVLCQSRDHSFDDHLKNYLVIDESRVYLEEEIDPMATTWQNSEFHWVEKDGEVYTA